MKTYTADNNTTPAVAWEKQTIVRDAIKPEKSSIGFARNALSTVIESLEQMRERIDTQFDQAVRTLINHKGKIVVCGVGKSGYVAKKIAATLSSTGTPAVFLHAYEAVHGDLGIYEPGDPTIIFSKSGATSEIMQLIPILRQFESPLIGIVGNMESPLAKQVDICLNACVIKEADPLGIVPTTSTLVSMAMADALACAVMLKRSFDVKDFARFHPGGQLGRNLILTVADVMHKYDEIPVVGPNALLREAVIKMTERPLGGACVVDPQGNLMGIVTDGDVRRALNSDEDIRCLPVVEVMTANPVMIEPDALLGKAVELMENRKTQIGVLPVVAKNTSAFLGLLRLHDIYHPDAVKES